MARGFAFSFDALVACIALLLSVVLLFQFVAASAAGVSKNLARSELSMFALSLSDSLVHERDIARPFLGSAVYDSQKKRVMPNVIDYALLSSIRGADFNTFSLSALYLRGEREEYLFNNSAGECVSVERFVVLGSPAGEKRALGVVVCAR